MAILRLSKGVTPGKEFRLEDGRKSTIGRSGDCEISLDVAAVSRRHAVVQLQSGDAYIEDLGSRNGTYVNGQRIAGKVKLGIGDKIVVCDQEFDYLGALKPQGLLGGTDRPHKSNLVQMVADNDEGSMANVMATIELGGSSGGSGSWSLSARPEAKLAALIEISQGLGRALSIEEVLPKILESLFKIFTQADRAFVVMRPEAEGPLVPVASKMRRGDDDQTIRISRTIVEEAMNGKKAILSADAATDSRFEMAQSIADFQIRSMMCVPLISAADESLGVIQVDTLNQGSRFTDEDLEVLAAVAGQAANAVDNAQMHDRMLAQQALQRDLDLAKRMQRALLPSSPPNARGYGFYDYYESARQVGGDYYDYVNLPGGRFAVILGDVAGKGVAAAIIMAKLSSDVRFALATEPDLVSAVDYVNRAFCEQNLEDRFVTMIFSVIDPSTNEVTLVNAGHMGPMHRKTSGAVEEIAEDISGLPIGVMDDYEFESMTLTLEPDESITLFTDGFSEAMNSAKDLYGTERLAEQVKLPAASVADLGHNVLEDVRKFVDGFAQSDDMCLCCFGRDAG